MAYNYPFPQPAVPGYFNANYMPHQPQMMQMTQQVQPQMHPQNNPMLLPVPDELTARSRAPRFKGAKPPLPTARGICPAPALAILRATALLNRVQPLFRRLPSCRPPPPARPPWDLP